MHFMHALHGFLESSLPCSETVDKNIWAPRAREMQEVVPENGVHENIVDVAASSHTMEATDTVVGMEAAPLGLQHSTKPNGRSKHGDGSQTEAAQDEGLGLPANKEDKVMDEQHEGSGGSSWLASPAAEGNGDGGQAQQKQRKKRAKNWTAEETDVLLLQLVSQMQNNEDRQMDKHGTCKGMLSQDQWEAVSQEVHGRTWEECRDRMDTLKKSYKSIKKYCYTNEKKFAELEEKDFQAMKPKQSPCFKEDWYNRIRDQCPPRPKRGRSEMAESVPRPSKSRSGFVSNTLTFGHSSANTATGNTFGECGLQQPDAGPSKIVIATPGGIESALATTSSSRIQALIPHLLGFFLFCRRFLGGRLLFLLQRQQRKDSATWSRTTCGFLVKEWSRSRARNVKR